MRPKIKSSDVAKRLKERFGGPKIKLCRQGTHGTIAKSFSFVSQSKFEQPPPASNENAFVSSLF